MIRELVLDTETTGLDFEDGHRIVEIGIVELENHVPTGEEFHYAQAIMRNVQRFGLRILYDRRFKKKKITFDAQFRKYIERLFALIHTPINLVQQFGKQVCQKLYNHVSNDTELKRHIYSILDFIHYFLKTWIECSTNEQILQTMQFEAVHIEYLKNKSTKGAKYKIEEWNCYGRDIRTTCAIEAFNRHHRVEVGYFPNLNKLISWYLHCMESNIRNFNTEQHKSS